MGDLSQVGNHHMVGATNGILPLPFQTELRSYRHAMHKSDLFGEKLICLTLHLK